MSPSKKTPTQIARKGGKARAKKLTKAQRSESARKAARARWGVKPFEVLRDAVNQIMEVRP